MINLPALFRLTIDRYEAGYETPQFFRTPLLFPKKNNTAFVGTTDFFSGKMLIYNRLKQID